VTSLNSTHFADRLAAAVRNKETSLCVGLDPRWDQLPDNLRRRYGGTSLDAAAAAVEEFSLQILEIVAPLVPAVKPQSACFEAFGPAGMSVLQRVIRRAKTLGLCTILDAKRNDIASTAQAYADAAFDGVDIGGKRFPIWDADALTVNAYLGRDAIEPFLKSARRDGRGLFVLVRTSNPGAGQFQDLKVDGEPLFHHVAAAVGRWGQTNIGQCGLSDVGAVAGATHPAELAIIRQRLPETWLLVPGFGVQGGTAADVAGAFRSDGLGAIVNSSRGITACFAPGDPQWPSAVKSAAQVAIKSLKESQTAAN
jgi:orotidine-5'-phosphate decarboxylase